MSEQKSGIEMISMILERLDKLEQKIDVLDQNIKKIANSAKMAELVDRAVGTPMEAWMKKPGMHNPMMGQTPGLKESPVNPEKLKQDIMNKINEASNMRFKFEPTDASKLLKKDMPTPRAPLAIPESTNPNVIVRGKMVTMAGDKTLPLPNVDVKIYDAQDKLVKETRTNRAGQWFSHLPVGKYVASMSGTYNEQELVPQNINFEVPTGVKEFEVK